MTNADKMMQQVLAIKIDVTKPFPKIFGPEYHKLVCYYRKQTDLNPVAKAYKKVWSKYGNIKAGRTKNRSKMLLENTKKVQVRTQSKDDFERLLQESVDTDILVPVGPIDSKE